MKYFSIFFILLISVLFSSCLIDQKTNDIIATGATIELIASGFQFTEGPAVDKNGRVYFTDQPNDQIHIWEENKGVSLYKQGTRRSNGMFFNKKQQLVSCADEFNQLIYFDSDKNIHVIAEDFEGKHLNGPNDLWIAPDGGIYFTDPYYHRDWWDENHIEIQGTRGVYYLNSNGTVTRVIDDFKKPNGIIGTPDGKTLYVADIEAKKIWKYDIKSNGQLSNKEYFAPHGSDGMTIDTEGNVYLTYDKVWVYNPHGALIKEIDVPERPSNVCFAGAQRNILFITARTSIYNLKMKSKGVN